MISVEEALELVENNCSVMPIKETPLMECLGAILAKDVASPIDMPPFAQSAMDGYAINYDAEIKTYQLRGEIQAGSSEFITLQKGEAVRIFTGAAVPDTATSVIRQEDAFVDGNTVSFSPLNDGLNIRPKAEQIKHGEIALHAGMDLNPAAIGFAATLGLTTLPVFPRPKITILTTGNELVKAGEKLAHGKIYESNSIMLESAFTYFGFREIEHIQIPDNLDQTIATIEKALTASDMLVISGGISVGDYDYVSEALERNGVAQIFHKVKQKPGKPLYFGKKGSKMIFALPGNPAAALTSFYLYILPSLNRLTGGAFEGCAHTELPLKDGYKRKAKRTEILKAQASELEVKILHAQSSAMLSSFSEANALVIIPEDIDEVEAGEFVYTLLL